MMDLDIFNAVKDSISTCKNFLLKKDVQSIRRWWIVENGHRTFEEMTYASYGPRFYIDDFGFLTEEEVSTIHDLDKKNASIFEKALETGDLSQLSSAIDNLDKIKSIYKMI